MNSDRATAAINPDADRSAAASAEPSSSCELWRLDAVELARLIRTGAVSSREAVTACLARLEAVNPKLNAVVRVLAEEALIAAGEADAARSRGETMGPLHGVPVTIKVNIDQAGHPTDNGIVANKDLIATVDNSVVANFRKAGAVIIGRTNTPGYSMRWFTDNDLHGATLNPWNPQVTPGGSSGGASSACAAGIGPIAHGNDIAGSVRYPAYCCGLVGMRPTFGTIASFNHSTASTGVISSYLMAVQGPLTRSVRDNRLAFDVMAQEDFRDPRWVSVKPPRLTRPIKVALVLDPGGEGVHPAVKDAVIEAGRCLARAGYAVEEVEPPHLIETAELWPRIAMPDVMALLGPLIEKNGDHGIKRSIALWREAWPPYQASDALEALGRRGILLRLWQEFFTCWPIIVMPVSTQPPFPVDYDLGDKDTTVRMLAAQRPLTAVSVLGLPGLSVPTGLHQGVPLGVQIVAGRYREADCYDAAEVIEAQLPMPTPIDPRGS